MTKRHIGSEKIRHGRDASHSMRGRRDGPKWDMDCYWRVYYAAIGGPDVKFSPRVAEIMARATKGRDDGHQD